MAATRKRNRQDGNCKLWEIDERKGQKERQTERESNNISSYKFREEDEGGSDTKNAIMNNEDRLHDQPANRRKQDLLYREPLLWEQQLQQRSTVPTGDFVGG